MSYRKLHGIEYLYIDMPFDLVSTFNSTTSLLLVFRYFDCVDVCKIRDDWTEARVAGVLPPFAGGPSEVVSLAVFSPTELDLCVYQKTSRLVYVYLTCCSNCTRYRVFVCLAISCRVVSCRVVSYDKRDTRIR